MSGMRGTGSRAQLVRLAVVLAAGLSTAACFHPLYGDQPISANETMSDKFHSIEIADIPAGKGTRDARLAVALRNALLSEFIGNGSSPVAPTYRLDVKVNSALQTVIVDVQTGLADTEVQTVNTTFTLTEIATNKIVLNDNAFARASYQSPSAEQRFARERARRDAEDRAVEVVAQNIRNRLASYFVAGT